MSIHPDKVTHIVYFGVAIDANALGYTREVVTEDGLTLNQPVIPEDLAFEAITSGDNQEDWLMITSIHTAECRCEACVHSMILLCVEAGIMKEVIDPKTGDVMYSLVDDDETP